MLYLIIAQVRPTKSGGAYIETRYGSHDNEVKNHNTRLQAQGYEVLEIKVEPWPDDGVVVSEEVITDDKDDPLYKADPAYDDDATPGFGELTDEDSDTDKAARSSD